MIKLQWLRGKSLGLAMMYLGIMGIFQLLFVALGQYAMQVGSHPITILVPIAVIITTFYCVLVNFESHTTMNEFRNTHKFKHSKKKGKVKKSFSDMFKNIYVRPVLVVMVSFGGLFFLSWLLLFALIDKSWVLFIVTENVGAIGVIIVTTLLENATGKKTR